MLKVPGTTKLSLSNSAIKSLYKKPIKRCQGHQHKIGLNSGKGTRDNTLINLYKFKKCYNNQKGVKRTYREFWTVLKNQKKVLQSLDTKNH